MVTEQPGPDVGGQHAAQQVRLPVSPDDLPSLLEALLLVSPEAATLSDLAEAAGVSMADVELGLDKLNSAPDKGWIVVRHNGAAHLATAPRWAQHVRHFLRIDRESRLSGAAMETLTLIAYRQPVTRAEIDALRGVDSSGVLATLHARGLIEIAGRLPTVGNPIQYATTLAFLQQFGLSSLADLPPLGELAEDARDRVYAEAPVAAEIPDESASDPTQ
ncbi:MAG: SMC-Scp complex subunit ScpB [Thermomicrobiales bacterium]|nr:SMC-Scp complex subunit ScpB [Thermomicrobiales bacterium]